MNGAPLRLLEVLSQIVTCDDNCPACRAAAQSVIESGLLELRTCPLCTRPFAPALGECRCTSFEDGNAAAKSFHGAKREPGDAVSVGEYRELVTARFSPLLAIMNPRRIPECMKAFERAAIAKVYMRGYTERELCAVFPDVVAAAKEQRHTHLIGVSDDVVISQTAVDAVLELLRAGDHVVTGYCRLDESDARVNLTSEPLRGPQPTIGAYSFWTRDEVAAWPEKRGRTWFAGMCLTGMPLELWERFPFQCFGDPGYGSDFSLSIRLALEGITITAARDAIVRHVKETWNHRDTAPEKQLLIGKIPKETVWKGLRAVTESQITLDRYAK